MVCNPRLDDPRLPEWQRNGLRQAVRAVTEAYLDAEDSFAPLAPGNAASAGTFDWVRSTEPWQSWKEWAETAGENPAAETPNQVLKDRGLPTSGSPEQAERASKA
jgi:hypothetical protein